MSDALAIAGVTAVLQFYLGNVYTGLTTVFGGAVSVTAQAPDRVQQAINTDNAPENQVNIFMHQVTHNPGWRNSDLPSLSADGKTRLQSPPLALDLHYLLTVYGSGDWHAEALLGYALLMLHENPVMTREDIRNAFTHLPTQYPGNALATALALSGLADQIELIKITPAALGREEMAWLWTALKADYRTTYPFLVSVVLLQPQRERSLAWPVLYRDLRVSPQAPAQLLSVLLPAGQNTVSSGDLVTLSGEFLRGFNQITLASPRLGIHTLVLPSATTGTAITFTVPNDAVNFPAGIYSLSAQQVAASKILAATNPLDLAVAPVIPTQIAAVLDTSDAKLVTIHFTPNARQGQSVSLALSDSITLGSASVPAQPFTGSQDSLTFAFPPTLASGPMLARLFVDGVPSQVQATLEPPALLGPLVSV